MLIYIGGEFVLTQQIPRAQSKAIVLRPSKGEMLIVTTNFRPVRGSKGYYRARMKHGVSEVYDGERYLHDRIDFPIMIIMNRKLDTLNADEKKNLLHKDGTAFYYGIVMPYTDANRYFDSLLKNISWKNDEVNIFGKHIITKREVAWYGDSDYLYTYSNSTRKALTWTKELVELKHLVEQVSGARFNSCLLNLYHDGNEGLGWHSDDEKSVGKNTSIASLSFGAERKFSFKHKQTKQIVSLVLEHGSLLVMKDVTQAKWLHSLLKSNKITQARINLTFRMMV